MHSRFLTATIIILLTGSLTGLQADDLATQWLGWIDNVESVDHMEGVVKTTITTSSGAERTLTAKMWSAQGGDVSLMAYTDPPRVAGDKILQRDNGDNIWYYMKRRDVTRHFSGHTRRQKAMGSDFSYEDMASGDLKEDYTAEFIGEEMTQKTKCAKLKLKPTESGPSYDHLILWVALEDTLTRQIEYYDKNGLLKTLTLSDIKLIDGKKIPCKMLMDNQAENSRTLMEYESISFKVNPPEWYFGQDALTRDIR